MLACTAPALAAGSAAAPADSVRGPARVSWTEQPRVVMLRALVLPGWGQWHNHSYVKCAMVAGAEGWLGAGIVSAHADLAPLLADADAAFAAKDEVAYAAARNRYNARLDQFVGRQWLLGGVLAYAMIDAYVDAHFRNFDLEFRTDPALPQDGARGAGASAPGTASRLALRWTF